jgi:UDP-2-acetamido-3-amino-2,3-dideoxy-glucuronate N-acetyltransferase
MMRSDKTRVACVGAGNWGVNLIRNIHALGALHSICEADDVRRAAVASNYPDARVVSKLEDVLGPDVDAVVIATPAETHGDLVERALLAGKDVLVEKPLCLSLQQAHDLVALAEAKGRVLMVGHLLWYHPAVLKLREMVDAGVLGQIRYIYSNRLSLGRFRREENILWSFAPHDISVILGLVGEMPESVCAQGGNYLHSRIADVTVSCLAFPSGVRAHVFVSWLHPYKEQKLIVVGDRAMAVFDDVEPTDKLTVFPHTIEWRDHLPIPNKASRQVVSVPIGEPLLAECEEFLRCVRDRATPRTNGREAIRVLTVLQQCQNSLDDAGTQVKPPAMPIESRPRHFVHESSYVDHGVEIGDDTTIWHFSHVLKGSTVGSDCRIGQNVVIGPNARVGNGVKIQNNVSVYEGVELEDFVFCGPSMVFTNVYNPRSEIPRMHELARTLVRQGATLGANSTVVCGVTIGRYAFVGAGAVVLRDVPDHALVVGNPGRIVGWMCACGNRIEFQGSTHGQCVACGKTFQKDEQLVRELPPAGVIA